MQGKMSDLVTQLPQLSESSRRTLDANCSVKRVYQVWKGSNRFFLGGRIIFGPDARSLIFTIFLIVSPVIFFCIFVSGQLINEFQHHLGGLIAAVPAAFTAYILLLLFLTSGRDPGIIPRNPHPPEPEEEGDSSSLSTEWAATQGPASTLPPTKEVLVNGTVIKIKYCHTCMLYRPPRCSHCSICNNCVERFDHHCPWVGQCIGKRNYRFFFMFVFSTTMLDIYVLAFCWVNIKYIMEAYHCNLWKALQKSPVSGVLILYTFIGIWFVGGLTSFHIYLISTNQTTYENFRYRYDGKTNPYNIGLVANVAETFFSKIPRSKNNFHAKVKENTVSNFTSSMGRVMSPELPKTSFDLEMGGKRQTVAEEELEDIHNQIETVAGLERCGTQPRHTNWGHKGNWEITPDVNAMASEFGRNHCVSDREKINGIL